MKCYDEKKKTKLPLNKRLDKNSRLKNFQHEHYARKRTTKGKIDAKGYQRDVKEHFVFGQNVTKMLPSEIADTLLKRDANKFYNLQFPGNLKSMKARLNKLIFWPVINHDSTNKFFLCCR